MTEELKILDSKICGNSWIGVTGELYHIQVGADVQNSRVAFKQFDSNKCAWVKKGQEEEALKLVDNDPAENSALFDESEPQEALTTFLMQTKTPCSHPDKLPYAIREAERKPTRPDEPYPDSGLAPMAHVFHTAEDWFPSGFIYGSQDTTKCIYIPKAEDGSHLIIEKARYVELTRDTIQIDEGIPKVLYKNMTDQKESVSIDDKKHVLRSYHGQRKADALIKTLALS